MTTPYLELAESIARKAHARQTDKHGAPYIHHVERVAALVDGDAFKATAWLHDVVEDTPFTGNDLLDDGIPKHVVDAVLVLTKKDYENYEGYIDRVVQSRNVLATMVKCADLADHLTPTCPPQLRQRYENAVRVIEESYPRTWKAIRRRSQERQAIDGAAS